jgi:hypothetical protein
MPANQAYLHISAIGRRDVPIYLIMETVILLGHYISLLYLYVYAAARNRRQMNQLWVAFGLTW